MYKKLNGKCTNQKEKKSFAKQIPNPFFKDVDHCGHNADDIFQQ